MSVENRSRLCVIISMSIFGTVGLFCRFIPIPSSMLAMLRGSVGGLFLLAYMLVRHKKPDFSAVKNNFIWLLISGAMLGFNWILLFEAYKFTSIAAATLSYYMAPILIILVSPVIFHERINLKKKICVCAAAAGIVLVSGVLRSGVKDIAEFKGILLGLAAAVLYACIVLVNKRTVGIDSFTKTFVQLIISSVTLVPYVLITGEAAFPIDSPLTVTLVLIVCIVHTGIAYALYFGPMEALPAQTTALLSYIDPVLAVLLSALVLKESMTFESVIGAALVIGATMCSEIDFTFLKHK